MSDACVTKELCEANHRRTDDLLEIAISEIKKVGGDVTAARKETMKLVAATEKRVSDSVEGIRVRQAKLEDSHKDWAQALGSHIAEDTGAAAAKARSVLDEQNRLMRGKVLARIIYGAIGAAVAVASFVAGGAV